MIKLKELLTDKEIKLINDSVLIEIQVRYLDLVELNDISAIIVESELGKDYDCIVPVAALRILFERADKKGLKIY
jgi:hypothetical protein